MSVYEFAPARLNDRTQLVLQVLVAVITVGAIGALLVAAWPSSSTRWIQISLVVLSVAIAATFNYRGSSIDRLFAFGFTATILASLGPFANPVFAVTAWMLGVLIGQWVQHRSFLLGTESTMYMGLAAGALVAVWQLTISGSAEELTQRPRVRAPSFCSSCSTCTFRRSSPQSVPTTWCARSARWFAHESSHTSPSARCGRE